MADERALAEVDSLAEVIAQFRNGDRAATNHLVSLFYPDLRRMAAAQMRSERSEHSWQPTVLVNELYLELLKIKPLQASPSNSAPEAPAGKEAFMGLAAHVMRRLLIHHARPLATRSVKVPIAENLYNGAPDASDVQHIQSLLAGLEEIDPRIRRVVEMRVFEGLSMDDIAGSLRCSQRTVLRYWSFARQWLQDQLAR